MVDCASFVVLLNFVIAQGAAGEYGFVERLVEFHELLVNPRIRRLRERHFRLVCTVPSPIPHVLLLKVAYACPPQQARDGWIDYFGNGLV